MVTIQIAATFVLFLILVIGILKKMQPTVLMLFLGIFALGITCAVMGVMPGGEETSGNFIVDLFEVVKSTFSANLAANVLNVISVIAYVHYMDHLKATTMFATLATLPLKKVKSPYIVLGCGIVLMGIICFFIQSATARAALFIGILYPIFISVGLSPLSAATACVIGSYLNCGSVASALNILFWSVGDPGISLVDYGMKMEIKVIIINILFTAVIVSLLSRYYDKKDKESGEQVGDIIEAPDIKELGIPKWYAILPTLPLVILLIFSVIIKTVTISLPGACFMSFTIAFLAIIITAPKGKKIESVNAGQEFFKGMGEGLTTVGSLMLCSAVFAAALDKIGGFAAIVKLITGGNSDSTSAIILLGVVITILYAVTIVITGNMGAFAPLFTTLLSSMASGNTLCKLMGMLVLAGPTADWASPISTGMLVASGSTNVPVTKIIKRTVIPTVASIAVVIVSVLVLY